MRLRSQVLACWVLALAGSAFAGPSKPQTPEQQAQAAERAAERAAKAERRRVKQAQKAESRAAKEFTHGYQLAPEELAERVETLQRELAWHADLQEARQAAIEANKPILWIQALGDLSGLL
ncbi:MAG: hypothetical protein R3F62_03215 [Planctomycetota bacterium]